MSCEPWKSFFVEGNGGGGLKVSLKCVVSRSSMSERASGCNQGGGSMFARFCRFRSNASHRGRFVRCGGISAFVGPWLGFCQHLVFQELSKCMPTSQVHGRWCWVGAGRLTPSKSRRSRRWRGSTVTSSISQRKAISVGRRPGGCGKAISTCKLLCFRL